MSDTRALPQASPPSGPQADPSRLEYLPQLDGLRAVAVLLVFNAHWVPFPALDDLTEWGRLGMVLFFLLSGFLITGILLRCRDFAYSPWSGLKAFYIRRTLRIFPLFYAVLLYFMIRGYKPVKNDILWFVTYLANLSAAFLRPEAFYKEAGHLWSLCVEEQFYLVWGLVVVLTPPRKLVPVCIGFILASLIYKLGGSLYGLSPWTLWISTPGNIDSLGLGSLLAVLLQDPGRLASFRTALLKFGPWLGIPAFLTLSAMRYFIGWEIVRPMTAYVAFFDLSAALSLMLLLAWATQQKQYFIGTCLSWAPLRTIGKVSYGMYLFHQPVRRLVSNALNKHFHLPGTTGLAVFLLSTLATIGLALASWHVFEKRINALRSRFSYFKRPDSEPSLPP